MIWRYVAAPMRRSHRAPKAATSLVLLLVLLVVVLAFTSPSNKYYKVNGEAIRNHQRIASTSQEKRANVNKINSSALGLDHPLPGLQKDCPLSPKLQPNVMSTFNTVSQSESEPESPEQSLFVQGYTQINYTLSTASYIPLSHKATQGIILPAGGAHGLGQAYVTVQLLRESLNCILPIEIWPVADEIDNHTKAVFEVSMTLCFKYSVVLVLP